ncbi:MAG: TolC family protein [Lentisphaeria bacterium]|nr:TolC family protein [Lentisphaeria bacterium]
MKSRILLTLFASLLAGALCAAEALKFTLPEAKKLALEQNPTIAKAQANIEAAMAGIDRARSSYLPTVDLNAGITRLRDAATRPNRDFDNTTQYSLGLSAQWLVFDGFARRFRYLSATLGGDMAIASCDDAKRLLLEQVAYAYYNVLQAQNSMEIAQKDAEFNRQLQDDAQKKKEMGTAKLSEVLNFEYKVHTAEANFINSQRSWRVACVTLGQLLNIQQDTIWECLELEAPGEESAKMEVPQVSMALDYALENRPDLRAARQEVENAELAVKESQAAWYPTVSAFFNYGFERTHSAHFNTHYDRNATYGLKASWNLFDGLNTQANIAQAKANLLVAQKNLENLQEQLEAEIRQNCLALQSAQEVLDKENSLLEIATKIRDLVYEEYIGGTAAITRVNEVQTDLTNTSLARSNAWIAVLNAIETLSASTGSILK